jgi:hypothetical protein
MTNRRLALTVGIVFVLVPGAVVASSAPPAARPPKSAVPRLSDATVAEIQALAKGRSFEDFQSLMDLNGATQQASITSARASIAASTALVANLGAKYVPDAKSRDDVLIVKCGHASGFGRFNCASLEVTTAGGVVVVPYSYEVVTKSEESYKKDGTTWKARVVEGRYPLDGLSYGFKVRYKSPDGKEWPFGASGSEAQKVLLMNLKTAPAR